MASFTGNFSFIGWFFVPRVVTYLIQTIYYVAVTPLGETKPAPNSARHKRDKARIFTSIISLYLLFTIADDFYSVINDTSNPNSSVNSLYSILEMKTPVPGAGSAEGKNGMPETSANHLRSSFRKLSRKYHPDKVQAQASAAQREAASRATAGTGGAASGWMSSWRTGTNKPEEEFLSWTPEQIDKHFIKIKAAYDVLSNPVTRYGYERFGNQALKWAGKDIFSDESKDGSSSQDSNSKTLPVGTVLGIMLTGLKTSLLGFYLGTFGVVIVMYFFNYPKNGHAWRLFVLTLGLVIELFVLTRPLNMVYSVLPFMSWLGLMPYQFVTILHKLMITSLVALNQLGPIMNEEPENDEINSTRRKLSPGQKKAAAGAAAAQSGDGNGGISGAIPPLSSSRGQQLLEKQLEFLDQLSESISHESTQAYRHQMLPFVLSGETETIKEATVSALVERQLMNDLEVKDAVDTFKKNLAPGQQVTAAAAKVVDIPSIEAPKMKTGKPVKANSGGSHKRTLPRNKF